ncbi:MAG: hypothetical protein V1936_02365 [Patescibacteria group bacterium]
MNHKKNFHAPPGFEIERVHLTPEQKNWLTKAREAARRLFPKQNSVE